MSSSHCLLSTIREISEEEWALLQVHLAYCDSCRRFFEEYKQIHDAVIPEMAAAAAQGMPVESQASLEAAQERLMSRLSNAPANESKVPAKSSAWRLIGGMLAACAIVLVGFASWHVIRGREAPPATETAAKSGGQLVTPPTQTRDPGEIDVALQKTQQENVSLRQQLSVFQSQSTQAESAGVVAQQQLRAEREERDQIASQKDALGKQLVSAHTEIQALKDKLASAESGTNDQSNRVAALEAKVRTLTVSLEETSSALNDKDRMLALDQDFLAHDRDIRDLIGARNLYIADIFDTTQSGKAAKPFGRLFYTKDRSLVFYGFDLEKQEGLKQSAAFQVWGSGTDKQPVSLGMFYQDDNHKRWVLRSNDAKTLARLNMVFVTVEPPGGSHKPTGKQLLRAYLQVQPNHP